MDGLARAVEYAQTIRHDAERLGLQSRIGVHTGECERLGEDLGGMAVHIAARIMDESEPQHIMASQTVKDLMVGSEIPFTDAGTRRLKGVPGDWKLYFIDV